ncbi:MAG: putative monooxygenase [Acidimicrobiales bacterium]|nr:MAG: putative monooxygenase [Acidimicrobiales bacterium]
MVDVVIVGGGPTGLTAACLCERLGLEAIVLERRDRPQEAPAAHVVNARTFEIWRQAGMDMERILAAAHPPAEAGWVHFVTRLGGDIVGSLPFERQGDEMYGITPTPLRNLSQHHVVPILADHVRDLRHGHAFVAFEAGDDGVVVDVDGPDGRYRITADWLVAADGAASPVRRSLGIEMDGPRTIQSFLMIHLAGDLRPLTGAAPGVLHFLVDPEPGGVFVSHGADREWVFMHEWEPEHTSIDAYDDDRCRALVLAALAPGAAASVDFEVRDTAVWHMSAQVAREYHRDRVFLTGDAAHRFPPTGGLGLNSGVADAHNLIWKLAAVHAGWAPDTILETYEAERRPVAQFNCDQSLLNALGLAAVPAAFGFEHATQGTTAHIEDVLADPERRAAVQSAIAEQAIHFDLLGLQLGHTYDGPLVVDDGTTRPPLAEPARDYQPSTRPGGRLPHAWLPDGSSTLDLVDRAAPTILVRAGDERPTFAGGPPVVVADVPKAVWSDAFALEPGTALIVRPDQHVAARVRLAEVDETLASLFMPPEPT